MKYDKISLTPNQMGLWFDRSLHNLLHNATRHNDSTERYEKMRSTSSFGRDATKSTANSGFNSL